jgi:NAD-dependent SIR2 family protein deacetylase
MGDGVKFCPSCGTPAGGAAPKPATEKVGKVRKCPACGAEVPSLVAVCPDCGHEFSNVQVSSNVTAFFDKIAAIDAEAQENPAKDTAAGKDHRIKFLFGLIVVIIVSSLAFDWFLEIKAEYTLMGGAVVVIVSALALFAKKVSFSKAENRKKGLIETFPIPNTREDIIEFLMLASSQIVPSYGVSHEARRQQAWNKIWAVKCRQVYLKTDVVFAKDKESQSIVGGIRKKTEKAIKMAQLRMLIATSIAVAAIAGCAAVFFVQRAGIGISVPESVTIASENVTLAGAFADSLKVIGSGVTITTDKAVSRIKMTVELEATEDLDAVIERQVQQFAKSKHWDMKYCTYEANRQYATVSGVPEYYDIGAYGYIEDILKLKPGTSRVLTVFEGGTNRKAVAVPAATLRKAVALFMAREDVEIRHSYRLLVSYRPPAIEDRAGDNFYLE